MDFLKDRQICFHWFFKRFISLIVYSYHNPHKKWFIVLIFFYLIEINLCRCTNCLCPPNEVVFAPFLIIITSPRLLLGDVLLFCVSFSLLLLRLPDCCRVTYCYSVSFSLLLLCLPFERRETYCFSLIFSSSASASSQRNLSGP